MGQTLTFPISSNGITVPKQHCDVITNLCVKLEIDSTSLYTDTTPELSDACADIRHYINCFTDLAAIQLVVVTTPPVTYNPGYRKDIVAELTVMNHGGIIIEASDDYNFKPTVFLTNSADFASASYKNPLEGVFTTFDDKITSKTPTTLQEFPIPITIPTNKFECEEISHLCLQLNHNIARYNDTDPNNDFVCISFGEVAQGKAGTFSCNVSVDLEVPSQTFSPVDVYTFDQVASVDVILSVTNTGPGDIARTRGSSVNYDVTAYLTDSANFEDATVRIRQADVDITLAQLQQELKSGQSVSFAFSSDILVPTVNCSRISHVCFSVTLRSADDRVYTDVDSSNNDVCIEFGPKEEGKAGKILCYVDLAALSLVVLDPQPLTYVPGEDTDVLVRLTVTNYGGLDVSTAPSWTHNFGTEVYLADSENLYTSTNISQPTVDKLFLHEVGSHFRVSLPVFYVKVNIPIAIDCKNIRYLCTLLLHNELRYLDVDRSNDYVCIRFGPVDGGMAGILECDGVTDYPATQAHPRSTAVTVRQRPITTQQTRDRYTTSRDSDHDIGASDGLGKLRTEGLALHYVMIIVSLVFITVVVIAVVIIKCRHKGAPNGICYR
ncbi:uncharacterized protein [Ptychodera flava]|uniref:uncharacterized protein n=1 Tax=Ptychodera flava TaxID=63121 RepID=UPI00396A4410